MNRMRVSSFFRALLIGSSVLFTSAVLNAGGSADPMNRMTSWCVDQMARWSPPGVVYFDAAKETSDEARERYASIAHDAISVAYDPNESPLFPGTNGRVKTLAMLLAVAHSESGLRKDVDFGDGPRARGDGGRSWCLMQVQLGLPDRRTGKTTTRMRYTDNSIKFIQRGMTTYSEDISGQDLIQDRKTCFRVALRIMRISFAQCSKLPVLDRLAMYTSGKCDAGYASSRARVGKAIRWLAASAPPEKDDVVSESLVYTSTPFLERLRNLIYAQK